MGMILKKTFEGNHRWIETPDKNKIDAMFFTATSTQPNDDNPKEEYKKYPSFILCNPNAMFY
jgi:hypothetical protein